MADAERDDMRRKVQATLDVLGRSDERLRRMLAENEVQRQAAEAMLKMLEE